MSFYKKNNRKHDLVASTSVNNLKSIIKNFLKSDERKPAWRNFWSFCAQLFYKGFDSWAFDAKYCTEYLGRPVGTGGEVPVIERNLPSPVGVRLTILYIYLCLTLSVNIVY